MGRFTQIDPIMGNRPSQHYAYAGNNPVSMVDPMGEDWTLSDAWEGVKASVAKAANFAKGIYHVGPMTGPHRLIEAVVADRGGFIDSTEYVLWGGGAKALVADAEKRGQVLMDHGKMSPYSAGIVGSAGAVTDAGLMGIPSSVETILDPKEDVDTKADAASNVLFAVGMAGLMRTPTNMEVKVGGQPKSLREQYLGRTPGKGSRTGREVAVRLDIEGIVRKTAGGGAEVKYTDPSTGEIRWNPISECDMSHLTDAVSYWNNIGRFFGAKAPEVREWMLDSQNYTLEPRGPNRSRGASLRERYLPPIPAEGE